MSPGSKCLSAGLLLLWFAAAVPGVAIAATAAQPQLVSVEFSSARVEAGDVVTVTIQIAHADEMMWASMVGPGVGNVGRLAEWRRDGDTFTATIAVGPLRSGEYRIQSLRFLGTDGHEYWVMNAAMSQADHDAFGDCAKTQWVGASGLGADAYSCNSWILIDNGFEVSGANTSFLELVSLDISPARTHPGGNVTIEVTVGGDTVESIEEVQLASAGGETFVAWGSEFTGDGPVFTGPFETSERAPTGEYRVLRVAVGTEAGIVMFVADSELSDVSCADGFDARLTPDEGATVGTCYSEVLAATPPLLVYWSSDSGTTAPSTVPVEDSGSSPATVADSASQTTASATVSAAPIAAGPEPNSPATAVTMVLVGIVVILAGIILVLAWRLRRVSG